MKSDQKPFDRRRSRTPAATGSTKFIHGTRLTRYPFALVSALGLAPWAAVAQSPAPVQLPDVVVRSAAPAEQAKQELQAEQAATPGGVSVLDGEEFHQRNVTHMGDMVRFVPGVFSATASGGEASFFSIRGSNLDAISYDMNGIKLMQDGLPVTNADGNNHNRFINPLAARHVVVARGANALAYGASTLGGAMDFISPTALDSPRLELSLNGGSFGHRQARFSAGMVSGRLDGMATIELKRWDGFQAHSRQERESVYANVGLHLTDAVRTRFYYTNIGSDQQLGGVLTRAQYDADPRQAEAAAVTGNYQINVDTWRLANKTIWDIDRDSSLSVGLSYEEQKLYHPIVQNPFFSLLIDTTQKNSGASLRYNRRIGEHDLLFGANYGQSEVVGGNYGNNGGNRTFLRTAVVNKADGLDLFAVDRWRLVPQWTLVYGAQATFAGRNVHETTAGTGAVRNPNADYDSINPRAGVIYHLTSRTDLFANISRLYEAPTNYQLADNVAGGNQTLDAMRGMVIEVGSRGRKVQDSPWHWDVALYYGRLRDEILSIDDPAAPGTSLSTNVERTIHAGIEALVGASFPLAGAGGQRIEPLVNLTLNRFRYDGDRVYGNNRLPAAPTYALRGEVMYRNAAGFFAGPTFDAVGERYADHSNTYKIESYTLWGLRAGFTDKGWEVFGELRNLSDRKYIAYHRVVDVAAANAALLYAGEPRSVYVGAKLKF